MKIHPIYISYQSSFTLLYFTLLLSIFLQEIAHTIVNIFTLPPQHQHPRQHHNS